MILAELAEEVKKRVLKELNFRTNLNRGWGRPPKVLGG